MATQPRKRPLEQRWRDLQLEALETFLHSVDRARLKQDGLRVLGRTTKPTSDELHEWVSALSDASDWMSYHERCKKIGAPYGLDSRTVMMACLVKGYHPDSGGEEMFSDLAAT